jgi:hypothetical protein
MPLPAYKDRIVYLTKALRTGDDPLWTRLRMLLRDEGIDPMRSLLAEIYEDDMDWEFGIFITPAHRVYVFDFVYRGGSLLEGRFVRWQDITDIYETEQSYSQEIIRMALSMVEQEQDPPQAV